LEFYLHYFMTLQKEGLLEEGEEKNIKEVGEK
jgi:hypothetical protein